MTLKRFFTLLILSVSFGTFAQVNQVDAKGRKQGAWQKQYPKMATFEYKGQFRDGKPVGTFTHYYKTGKVKAVVVHGAGGRSVATMYHESGQVYAKGIYKNQLKDSVWDYYGPSGRQSLKETYSNDKLNGKSTVFYVPEDINDKNLSIARESFYVNGVLNGPVREFYEFGTIKMSGNYVSGEKNGLFVTNHPNGKKMMEERYKGGFRHGWCATYDPNGKELGRKYFYHGKELQGAELDRKMKEMKELGISPNG